jgi:S1-C subfamily serine protease
MNTPLDPMIPTSVTPTTPPVAPTSAQLLSPPTMPPSASGSVETPFPDAAGGWTPPSSPVATGPSRPRGRARFVSGIVVGAAVTAAALGGYVAGQDNTSTSTAAPAATVAAKTISAQAGSISDLVHTARPSIVSVHQTITQSGPYGGAVQGTAAGTGFVLSADGYIVTNNHVIADGSDTEVTFSDGTSKSAKVVAADPTHDLAVLKVDRTGLTPLAIGNSDDLRIGDPLIAVGYALDLNGEPSVTAGILSAKDRTITEENGEQLVNLLQTDTAINPGNSGGPLLNSQGQVVGINTAIAGQAQNIGFAIAITPVMNVIDSLQSGTVPDRALMGVSTQPADSGKGAAIVEIAPGSGAAASGLKVGDVVTAVDGQAIDQPSDLGVVVATHKPGDKVTVTVDRNGKSQDITVTLGKKPT